MRIFVNYRRAETRFHTTQLREALAQRFGEENIFWDIDTIDLGVDFAEAITDAVGSCDVFVAVIGKEWVSMADESGERRLDNPEDYVRIEIEAALERGVRVIPARVQGAPMPRSTDLPEPLRPLARRNGLELTDTHWQYDVARLVRALENVEREKRRGPRGDGASATDVEVEPAEHEPVAQVEEDRPRSEEADAPMTVPHEAAATEPGARGGRSVLEALLSRSALAPWLLAAAALVGVLLGVQTAARDDANALLVAVVFALPAGALVFLLVRMTGRRAQALLAALAALLGVADLALAASDGGAYTALLVLHGCLALGGAAVAGVRARRRLPSA
ncbi:MAG: toll/interleukin-1 receptor domain-containing protein [Thermoleophilia bacterium]|nr:toll/interleukin-1 receptor domain-containing protein [Thermoleophilia bacterium]